MKNYDKYVEYWDSVRDKLKTFMPPLQSSLQHDVTLRDGT